MTSLKSSLLFSVLIGAGYPTLQGMEPMLYLTDPAAGQTMVMPWMRLNGTYFLKKNKQPNTIIDIAHNFKNYIISYKAELTANPTTLPPIVNAFFDAFITVVQEYISQISNFDNNPYAKTFADIKSSAIAVALSLEKAIKEYLNSGEMAYRQNFSSLAGLILHTLVTSKPIALFFDKTGDLAQIHTAEFANIKRLSKEYAQKYIRKDTRRASNENVQQTIVNEEIIAQNNDEQASEIEQDRGQPVLPEKRTLNVMQPEDSEQLFPRKKKAQEEALRKEVWSILVAQRVKSKSSLENVREYASQLKEKLTLAQIKILGDFLKKAIDQLPTTNWLATDLFKLDQHNANLFFERMVNDKQFAIDNFEKHLLAEKIAAIIAQQVPSFSTHSGFCSKLQQMLNTDQLTNLYIFLNDQTERITRLKQWHFFTDHLTALDAHYIDLFFRFLTSQDASDDELLSDLIAICETSTNERLTSILEQCL